MNCYGCVVPENVHTPSTERIGFLLGGGFTKTENFKEMYGV